MATYGDGLADVDLHALIRRHEEGGRLATMTVTGMPSPYGTVEIDASGLAVRFIEKPILLDVPINAGFFVFERDVFERYSGDSLEADVLPRLAKDGQLVTYRHDGFWRSVDTFKDLEELELDMSNGKARWGVSRVSGS